VVLIGDNLPAESCTFFDVYRDVISKFRIGCGDQGLFMEKSNPKGTVKAAAIYIIDKGTYPMQTS
jgi:hypothetical protein